MAASPNWNFMSVFVVITLFQNAPQVFHERVFSKFGKMRFASAHIPKLIFPKNSELSLLQPIILKKDLAVT